MIWLGTTQHIQIAQKSSIVHFEPQTTLDAEALANQLKLTTGNGIVETACGQGA